MYVSEGKAKISRPHTARTNQPINTRIGTFGNVHHTTNRATFGHDRARGVVRARGWNLHSSTKFLKFFFSSSIPITTSEYGPMFVVETSNDVFPCKVVPPYEKNCPNLILGGLLPQKPAFFPKSWLFATGTLNWTCRPHRMTYTRQKWLSWRSSMNATRRRRKIHKSSHRERSAPQKPHFLGVLWSAKNSKNDQKSTFSDLQNIDSTW